MIDWVVVTICVALMLMLNVLWVVAYDRLSAKTARLLEKAQQERRELIAAHDSDRNIMLAGAARERQALLDRIQAKDLTEYKTMTREPVPVTPKEPKEIIKPI